MDSSQDASRPAPCSAAVPRLGLGAARIVLNRRSKRRLHGRLPALALIGCMAATQAAAQAEAPVGPGGTGSGLPTAEEIWRHLPGRERQADDPQPDTDSVATPDTRPAAPEAGPVPTESMTAPQTALSRARVVIHHASSEGPARSQELARRLRDAGAGEVEVRTVDFGIDRQSIRYFHEADRVVSEALRKVVRRDRSGGVDDFTHFRPLPSRGTVEIWLP